MFSINRQVKTVIFGVRFYGWMLQVWDAETAMWKDVCYVPRRVGQRIVASIGPINP